jgi:hypothetical protein
MSIKTWDEISKDGYEHGGRHPAAQDLLLRAIPRENCHNIPEPNGIFNTSN